ncbi:hypothetical protein Tco_0930375 [Tanacetum coccineum]
MRKHGYGYLEEIIVRRADNALYRFKECDFPRLRINDIEDMLLLVVQNWLTNLSGDDVADFAIALRMFTRSLAIQKHQQAAKGKKDDEILEKIFVVVDLLTETQTDAKKNMTSSYCAIISKCTCLRGRLLVMMKTLKCKSLIFISNTLIQLIVGFECDGIPKRRPAAGNPVKEILLKLNLPDHRSILTDSKEYLKMVMEVPDSS